jgi:hypothetical protein
MRRKGKGKLHWDRVIKKPSLSILSYAPLHLKVNYTYEFLVDILGSSLFPKLGRMLTIFFPKPGGIYEHDRIGTGTDFSPAVFLCP